MAIVTVKEMQGRRSGTKNALWQRTYTRVWRVITDNPTDGVLTVASAVDPITSVQIPSIGASYNAGGSEVDHGAFIQDLAIDEESEDGLSWLVKASYGPYDASTFKSDPTQWPIKVTIGGDRYERVVLYDQAGNPILNSAGDAFEEPITIDESRTKIVVVRQELCSTFDLTLAESFRDTLNEALWNGFDPKTVKVGIIATGENQYDTNNEVWYFSVTYPFEVNRDGWKKKLLDQGFAYLDGSGKLRQLLGSDGHPLKEPTLLDGSGHQLASGGTPVYIEADVYSAIDWNPLNIDFTSRLGA